MFHRLVTERLSAVCLPVLLLLAFGCQRSPEEQDRAPAGSAVAASTVTPNAARKARCKLERGSELVIGQAPRQPDQDAGEPIALPFAAELGSAAAYEGGFAVGALRTESQGNRALAALFDAQGKARVVELERVFGPVDPPQVRASGTHVVAALSDNDAGAGILRLVVLRSAKGKAGVASGAEFSRGRQSESFTIEIGERSVVLAWDAIDEKSRRGVIRAVGVELADPKRSGSVRAATPESMDAEAPRLTRRPGGFWLAWLAREEQTKSAAREATRDASDAGPREDNFVEAEERRLYVVPLDADGAPQGQPLAVNAAPSQVLTYDLVSLPDGGLMLAWRDDRMVGVEQGSVHVARVRRGGSLEVHRYEQVELGAGAPTLLFDASAPKSAPSLWLFVGDEADTTRFGVLEDSGKLRGTLTTDPTLGHSDVLAVRAGRFLTVRPDGRALRFSVIACAASGHNGRAAAATRTENGGE